MKQSKILLFVLLSLSTQAFAQGVMNADRRQGFNGMWIFDAKRSYPGYKALYEGQTLEISYSEPELKIVRTMTRMNETTRLKETKSATLVLYPDNRGEKNRPYPFNETLEVESKTVWVKDILVRTFMIKFYQSGEVVGGDTTQESYVISEDGETLTIIEESRSKITTDSPYGKLKNDSKGKAKLVYKRKK